MICRDASVPPSPGGRLLSPSDPSRSDSSLSDRDPAETSSPDLAGTGVGRLPMRRAGTVPYRLDEEAGPEEADDGIPMRYEVRETEAGRVLVCKEAPGVSVSIDRSHAFSEQEARKLGERVVLVDGAGTFSPLIDDAAHLYNLDHHEGCLRPFTLASCEQALILVLKGLELDREDWTIYANEPDLDTAFALWVLLNHRRVRELDRAHRDRILPLLRLEGAIDANGLEMAEYCGLPRAVLEREKKRLDGLMEGELEAKKSGVWTESDPAEYARDLLHEIDRMVYRPADFQDFASVEEEYGHVDIGQGKVAVVCRDSAGIYDVEKRLKKVWGERLGIVALEREPQQYTLRRAASLAGIDLGDAYERLNLLDPAVDGHPPSKKWGGSEEIGGSPRPTGTGLTPREIGKILKLTYRKIKTVDRLQRALSSLLWTVLLVAVGGVGVFAWRHLAPEEWTAGAVPGGWRELALAAVLVAVGSWLVTRRLSRGWTWLYGWRRPAGRDWLLLIPLGAVAAAVGGAPLPRVEEGVPPWALFGSVLLVCAATELLLRGMAHGQLVLEERIQVVGGSFFVSLPAAVTAALHAVLLPALAALWWVGPAPQLAERLGGLALWSTVAAGALVTGLVLGMVRERSLSLWPGILILALGSLLRWLAQGGL